MKDKTLYEVLEVSENASPEIIEKAYKVLAKKYHPDLQNLEDKQNAETKMKQINEAYEILGNEEKRKEYDRQLQQEREEERQEQEERLRDQEQSDFYNVNSNDYNKYNSPNSGSEVSNYDREKYIKKLQKEEEKQRKEMQEKLDKEYENAYYNYLRSLGYKVKHHWTKENIKDVFIVIIIMAIIITALWFIPPTHDWIVNFYEQNPIIKTIVDIIVGIVTGIFGGIWKFITGLFNVTN